jgi:hypothetical protein
MVRLSFSTWAVTLAVLSVFAASGALEYTVRDFNTLQFIAAANVTIYNDTFEYSHLTDANGYADPAAPFGNWSVKVWRGGYFPYDSSIEYLNTTAMQFVNLNPSSTQGIVRLRFSDLTMVSHSFCLYTTSNMRLVECYEPNGTIAVLHINTNYTLKPLIRQADILSTPSGLSTYARIYAPMLIGGAFTAAILLTIAIYIWRMRK